MMTRRPPRLAMRLLDYFLPDNEPLTGDLLEEFERRQSSWWLWRQVVAAILATPRARPGDAPGRLGLLDPNVAAALPASRPPLRRRLNLTASPIHGIGGLGLVALAFLITVAAPGTWLVMIAIVLSGSLLGIVLAVIRHRAGHAPAGVRHFLIGTPSGSWEHSPAHDHLREPRA